MTRPKIAILINSMTGGGSERTVSHLLHGLKDAFEIHLLLFSQVIDYDLPDGQIIEYLDDETGRSDALNLLKIPSLASRLTEYCDANNIQLVLSFLPRPNFVACLAKRRGLRAKVAISERVYTPMYYTAEQIRGRIGRWLTRTLYKHADLILPNSQGTLEALRDEFGITAEYQLVKNIVDIDRVKTLALEPVDDYSFKGITFVCAAAFRPQKNHRLLLDAFEKVADKFANLLLIGKGPELERVREYAATLSCSDRVTFTGHKSNPYKYVSKSDWFVLASDFEGFPNAILESLACSVPAVSTDCLTGPRELLQPTGEPAAGVLVPVGSVSELTKAMERAVRDGRLRTECAAVAAERALSYDKVKVIHEFRELLLRLIGT